MNYHLFRTINNWSGNGVFDDLMKVIAKDAILAVFVAFAALCVLRLRDRDPRPVVFSIAALGLTYAFGLFAGTLHTERRPFETHQVHQLISHDPGQSFPSDHATAAFGVAFTVLLFLSRSWGMLLFIVAVVIGFSRVYDGVHYPSDILGGAAVAVLGVTVAVAVAVAFAQPRRQVAAVHPPVGAARR
ncbi:MAG TPA: phosphatase PAP2 family protein [Sporichthyaceae bacterium]|nr:phosphatase PAP2 family protein [Sporichthyaceae bacterium]